MWQYTVNGSHKVTLFTIMPLNTRFELLETPYFCFQFPSLKKQVKQLVFCETHEFWTMIYGNWVISLSFVPIQTASK